MAGLLRMPSRAYSSPITIDIEKASADDLEKLKAPKDTDSSASPAKGSENRCRFKFKSINAR